MNWIDEYKVICNRRCADILAASATADDLVRAAVEIVTSSAVENQAHHRMWFDLRNQCMFDHELRRPVREVGNLIEDLIAQVMSRHAELAGEQREIPAHVAVATLDALFQQAVASATGGCSDATDKLRDGLRFILTGTA